MGLFEMKAAMRKNALCISYSQEKKSKTTYLYMNFNICRLFSSESRRVYTIAKMIMNFP